MASPLSWIRKYQKSLMAFFGIILIGIFTITLVLPNAGNMGPARPRQEDPVVMRWKDGQLKASEITELRFRHYQAMNFMEAIFNYASEKKKAPITPRVELITRIDQADPGNVELAEENIANRYLLAQEAERRGIVVSDAAVDDYLSLLVDNVPLTRAEMAAVARQVNDRTEYRQVREALRMELAARQMEVFISPGLNFPMNPTQAAQYYTRTSRLIECEILPYKVEDYLSKVTATPRAEELQKLYAEGRAHFPDPNNPNPGFKQERKVKLQYFAADYETFLTNEINKLTDQEVQAEYDRRVQANDMSIMEEVKPDDQPQDPQLPGDSAPEGQPDGEQPPATSPETPTEPEKKDGEPAADEPAQPAGEAPPAGDAPAEQPQEGGGEKADDQKDGDGAGQSAGQSRVDVPMTFVSLTPGQQEEQQEPAKETPPAEETPAEAPAAETPAQETPAQEESKPSEEAAPAEPASQEPAGETAPPAESAQATEQPAVPQEPALPVMRAKELKDVADQLKRSMKAAAAEEAMNAAIDDADNAVREFQSELQDWEGTPENERDPRPTIDPAAIAKRLNLQFVETDLLTIRELVDSEVGKITHYVRTQVNFAPETVAQYIAPRFTRLQPYETFTFRDIFSANEKGLQRSTNVFWLVEKVEAKIPTFEEARADIEKYWKHEQALALAKADAEKAAAEANSSGKKLSEMFGDKAIPTGQFPWFSAGLGSFGYFDIPGVDDPGEEFMSTAFGLQPGKAAVAANDVRSHVYVVRMLSDDTRSTEDMMKQFAESLTPQKPYPQSIDSVSMNYLRRSFSEWQEEFIDSQKIEWLNR